MKQGSEIKSKIQWHIVAILLIIVLVVLFFDNKINLSPDEVSSEDELSVEFDVGAVPLEDSSPTLNSEDLTLEEMKKSQKKVSYAKGELIVKFNSEVVNSKEGIAFSEESLNELATKYSVTDVVELFPNVEGENLQNTFLIKFNSEKDFFDAVMDYSADENVVYAELNFLAETSQVTQPVQVTQQAPPMPTAPLPPNDPFYSQQWYLPKINSLNASTSMITPSSVPVIAVIDTGVQWSHPDLVNNIWVNTGEIPNNNIDDDTNGFIDDVKGWDFVETTLPCYAGEDCSVEDNNPDDFQGHGTHVAGIAGAVTNNNLGVAGVCANFCKIMPVRAGFAYVSGGGLLEYDDIAQSLVYAADNGANIISMSFAGLNSNLMQNAINYAYSQGAVLVAAAGNSGRNDPVTAYPAVYPKVIAVGASNMNDQRIDFTNHGAWVDISAPGFYIRSTVSPTSPMNAYSQYYVYCPSTNECYLGLSGTSMSAPIVSGVIGLALAKNPSLTQDQILTLVHSSSDLMPPWTPYSPWGYTGTGRINAFKAVQSSSVSLAVLNPALDHSVNGPQPLQIIGTAAGQNFQKYRLDIVWGGDLPLNPSWTTVQPDTFTSVTNGILGTLNPQTLNLWPGTYTLRLLVTDTNGRNWEDRTVFIVDRSLVSGWGKTIPHLIDSPPVYADVDNDGDKELFFIALNIGNSLNNIFYAIDFNGLPLSGWPILDTSLFSWFIYFPFYPSVAVDNIDSDPAFEVAHTVPYISMGSQYYVRETTGALQPGWPVSPSGSPQAVGNNQESPVIANVDGGNTKEVIMISRRVTDRGVFVACGDPENAVYVYTSNGVLLPGWPQRVNCTPDGVAVGDVDANGDMEIVVSTTDAYSPGTQVRSVYVFNHDGTLLPGWPQTISGSTLSGFSTYAPVLGDIDQNDGGRLEIFEMGSDLKGYLFNHDGTLVPGWPHLPFLPAGVSSDASIGDVDNNGDIEIVFAIGLDLFVVNHDGTMLSGWPRYTGSMTGRVLIVDLNGDGFKELIRGNPARLATGLDIYNYDGTLLDRKPLMYISYSSYSAGDINNNGLIDLFGIDYLGNMYLWEFTGQATPQNLPWPMARHDAQNTGRYG